MSKEGACHGRDPPRGYSVGSQTKNNKTCKITKPAKTHGTSFSKRLWTGHESLLQDAHPIVRLVAATACNFSERSAPSKFWVLVLQQHRPLTPPARSPAAPQPVEEFVYWQLCDFLFLILISACNLDETIWNIPLSAMVFLFVRGKEGQPWLASATECSKLTSLASGSTKKEIPTFKPRKRGFSKACPNKDDLDNSTQWQSPFVSWFTLW